MKLKSKLFPKLLVIFAAIFIVALATAVRAQNAVINLTTGSSNSQLGASISGASNGDSLLVIADHSLPTAALAYGAKTNITITGSLPDGSPATVTGANNVRFLQATNGGFTITFNNMILAGSGTYTTSGAGIGISTDNTTPTNILGGYTFQNFNTPSNGGVFNTTTANATIVLGSTGTTVTLTGNSAAGQGGALKTMNAIFNADAVITSNSAGLGAVSSGGGAIYAAGNVTFNASATLANNQILNGNNYANGYYGGAILMNTAGSLLHFVGDATLANNIDFNGNGGAVRANGNVVADGNLVAVSNTSASVVVASANGGAFYAAGDFSVAGAFTATGNYAATSGGALYLAGSGTINGGSTLIGNTTGTGNGGAIYWTTAANSTLAIISNTADILFSGNTANGSPNAIAISNAASADTLNLDTGAGHAISFYDPISTTGAGTNTINITGSGAVLFDTYKSAITAATTVAAAATLRLANGAIYGASGTTGSFTLDTGATLSGNGAIAAAAITIAAATHLEATDTGTLKLQSANPVALGANQTLSGNGALDLGAPVTASFVNVGTLGANPAAAPETLTIAASTPLTIASGGTLAFDLFAPGSSDLLATGTLTLNGPAQIDLTGGSNGSYELINAGNDISIYASDFTTLMSGATLRFSPDGTQLWLDLLLLNSLTRWTGAGNGLWANSAAANFNWDNGSGNLTYIDGDSVLFDDTATGARTVTIDPAGVAPADMTVNNSAGNDYTFAGSGGIATDTTAGTGQLTKTGSGALNFTNTGANTFTGGIALGGGTIGFTDPAQLGDGGNGIHVTAPATLRANANALTLANNLAIDPAATATIDTGANTLAYTGALTAADPTAALAKTGAGALNLTTDNSAYAGATHVTQGTLALATPDAKLGGAIDIAPGATLSGNGAATGNVTAAPGAIIQPATAATAAAPQNLTINNLSLNSSTARFNLFNANTNDTLTITGALTATGTNTIDIGAFATGTFDLGNIAALAASQISVNGNTLGNGSRQTATLAASPNGLDLILTTGADISRILTWTGTTSALWTGADANWTDGARVTLFQQGDRVIFDATTDAANPANRAINIPAASVTVSDILVQGAADYTFTGGGITADPASVISGAVITTGAGALVKTGPGALAFENAANNFLGGIQLDGGLVAITNPAQLGDGGNGIHITTTSTLAALAGGPAAGTLAANLAIDPAATAALDIAAGQTLTLAGANTGAGSLLKTGAGNLVFTNPASLAYTGSTEIDQGCLILRGITAADAAAAAIVLNGGWLDLSDTPYDATGSTANNWTNLNIITGANAAAGGIIGGNDAITLGAGLTACAIGGSGSQAGVFVIVDAGDGVATLAGANNYAGYTRVDSGTLAVGANNQLGSTTANREVILNGGALEITAAFSSTRAIQMRADGAIAVDANVSGTWATIANTAAANATVTLTKAGSGTLALTGANTASALNVAAGRFVACSPAGAGAGPVTVASGATFEFSNIASGAIANNFSGAGAFAVTSSTLTLTGTNTLPAINVTGGSLVTVNTGASPNAFGNAATTLNIAGSSVLLNVLNTTLGAVNLTGATPPAFGFTLTGTSGLWRRATIGTLTGAGNLALNTNLALGLADQITITTAATGAFSLIVTNTGAAPHALAAPVTLVTAPAAATAKFTLPGGKIDAGMFSYDLAATTENGATSYQLLGAGNLSNLGALVNDMAGAQSLSWFTETESVSQRRGDLRMYAPPAGKTAVATWLRGYTQRLNFNNRVTGDTPFSDRQSGVSAGADCQQHGAGGDITSCLGAFAGYGEITRTADAGDGASDSYYGGLYATLLSKGGWYVDGVLKLNKFTNRFDAPNAAGQDVSGHYYTTGYGGSIEAGRIITRDDGWFVDPQVQASWARIADASYTTGNDIAVHLERTITGQIRGGLRFGRAFKIDFGEYLQVYGKTYAARQWTTGGRVCADDARFSPKIEGDRVEAGAGIAWLPRKDTQLYLDYEYGTATDYTKPWGITGGVRFNW